MIKSQRDSLLGQIVWVNMDNGQFYVTGRAYEFLMRKGYLTNYQQLNERGISLMADYGNLLAGKLCYWDNALGNIIP